MNTPPNPPIAKSVPPSTRKLVVVSNRLPVSLRIDDTGIESFTSSGGLASAVSGLRSNEDFAWVGWPGCAVPDEHSDEVRELLARDGLVPVFMDEHQEEHYYRGICNQALWPLFHYFTERTTFTEESWAHYVEANQRFADTVLELCEPGSRVWVHDFHLMLVPSMLRKRRPDLEIGFFLHIPFPSSEIYRLLPARSELLDGLLGADYIGFHTNDYARHFRSACLRVLGLESDPDSVMFEGRRIGIGTNPIGIDVSRFEDLLAQRETEDVLDELERRYFGRKLILGVERLDYTKGIPLKLQAFERFLERNPERAKDVTFLQVLVPSRLTHPEYRHLKGEIEEAVGRMNGKYGGPGVTPVEYMHRSLTPSQLVGLYRFADVCLVNPVRDGMNLIAQEFVLCQRESKCRGAHKGILVLSEFAGAAHYLSRSILVNPWSVAQTADALESALAMGDEEKTDRMRVMADQVADMDCHKWARTFLAKLETAAQSSRAMTRRERLGEPDIERVVDAFCAAERRIIALDYDGTLREITRRPSEASPTPEIRELLQQLADLPDTDVHIISGRDHATMREWFGDLPLHLCAEHGYVARDPGEEWRTLHDVDLSWMPVVEENLRRVTNEVPGTMVESKKAALAWHYRMADLDYGEWRARELLTALEENLANEPVEVLPGHRVIEIRASGIHKGSYLRQVLEHADPRTFVLCAGDDRTDTDMYRVLPPEATSIHVGAGGGEGGYTVESPGKLRHVLRRLVDSMAQHGQAAPA